MKIFGIIFIEIHAIIHLIGFLKAFKIIEFNSLNLSISKTYGILWLLAAVMFTITTFLLIFKNNYWWLFGMFAVLISQIVIVVFWNEAKYGTIINLIMLLACMFAYGNFSFANQVNTEVSQMLSKVETNQKTSTIINTIDNLPIPVQKWLKNCGIKNNLKIKNVYLKQEVLMKLKPQQKKWYKAIAQQYFITQPAAFNWMVTMDLNPMINLVGRDKLANGKGEMLIKVGAILPIVNEKNNSKINQATLQRYLAEIVWFPTAALSSNIYWEFVNDNCAKATILVNEILTSGYFYFNNEGEFIKFSAMRYKDVNDDKPKEWIVEVVESKVLNTIKIPVKLKATWKLDEEYFTWLQLKITEIYYNI
jgi:hypothetical protein